MAIRQERVLTLLSEAAQMKQSKERLVARIRDAITDARGDPTTTVESLCAILDFALDTAPHVPWEAHSVETYHFDKNEKRNKRHAQRMKDKRGERGYGKGAHAPRTQHLAPFTLRASAPPHTHHPSHASIAEVEAAMAVAREKEAMAQEERELAHAHPTARELFGASPNGDPDETGESPVFTEG